MQVNRSVSNQQGWLLECQLVYFLFRISHFLFGFCHIWLVKSEDFMALNVT